MRRMAIHIILAICVLGGSSVALGQLRLPRPSPAAGVWQTIGVTDIKITYNRPAVKGRKIWGDPPPDAKGETTLDNQNTRPPGMPIVPYGHVWRTGANEATQFEVTDDVLVNGRPLPAGKYSLHTIPGREEWIIVFNSTANQWGSFNYDPAKDTLRVTAKPLTVSENQEWLEFKIEPKADNAAVVTIAWEKVRVPFIVEIKDVAAVTLARARAAVESAARDDWQTPLNAANYAKQNNAPTEAEKWYARALAAIDEVLKSKENFQNLSRKANILLAAGKREEAIAVADKAIARGRADGENVTQFEKRFAEIKSGKP